MWLHARNHKPVCGVPPSLAHRFPRFCIGLSGRDGNQFVDCPGCGSSEPGEVPLDVMVDLHGRKIQLSSNPLGDLGGVFSPLQRRRPFLQGFRHNRSTAPKAVSARTRHVLHRRLYYVGYECRGDGNSFESRGLDVQRERGNLEKVMEPRFDCLGVVLVNVVERSRRKRSVHHVGCERIGNRPYAVFPPQKAPEVYVDEKVFSPIGQFVYGVVVLAHPPKQQTGQSEILDVVP